MTGCITIELCGGQYDGQHVTLPHFQDRYHMPAQMPVAYWPLADTTPVRMQWEVYQLDLMPGGRPATTAAGRLRFGYVGLQEVG